MTGLPSDTAKNAQQAAQAIAKQVAQEPFEILKDVGREMNVTNTTQPQESNPQSQAPPAPRDSDLKLQGEKDVAKSTQRFGALQKEIEDIRKADLFKDLQASISQGETPPLENYTELSMEQKQVLKAEEEAVRKRMESGQEAAFSEVPAIHSRPSRRFGAGQKYEAERQKTHVEKPVQQSV